MVLWYIIGLSILCVWIWSLLFVFSASKGGYRTRENEQKLCSEDMVNTQNIEDSIKEGVRRTQLILHS